MVLLAMRLALRLTLFRLAVRRLRLLASGLARGPVLRSRMRLRRTRLRGLLALGSLPVVAAGVIVLGGLRALVVGVRRRRLLLARTMG